MKFQRTLIALFLFLSLYSGALYAFATTYVTPGTVLDPSGLPGAYTVGPLLSYGGAVTTGHDNEILYTDSSGNLASDSLFTRNGATGETSIGMQIDTDNSLEFLMGDLGLGYAAVFAKENSADNVQAFVGTMDATFAGFSDTSGIMLASDNDTGAYAISIVDPTGRAVLYSSNAVSNLSSFEANTAGYVEIKNLDINSQYSSNQKFDSAGNTITWDADTTDTIDTMLEQSQDILGLGVASGSALTWSDSSTNLSAFVGALNLTSGGGSPATGFVGTSNSVTGDISSVSTWYDTGMGQMSANVYVANGVANGNLYINGQQSSINFDLGLGNGQHYIRADGNGIEANSNGLAFIAGDIDDSFNKTKFLLDDASEWIYATADSKFVVQDTAGDAVIYTNPGTKYFAAGDTNAAGNGTYLFIDDANQNIVGTVSGHFGIINDGSKRSIYADTTTHNIILGDPDADVNETTFELDDTNQLFTLSSPNSSGSILAVTNSDGTCTLDPGDVAGLSCPSDENLKKDIVTLDSALDNILALRPVTYRLKTEDETANLSTGLIAQEVQQIFPTLVKIQRDNTLALNYGGLTPFMIKAIQELNLKITSVADLAIQNSFRDSLVSWFADTANGIGEFFAGRVRTQTICLTDASGSETCLSKNDLDSLLLANSPAQTTVTTSTNNDDSTDESSETPTNSTDTQVNSSENTEVNEEENSTNSDSSVSDAENNTNDSSVTAS